MKLKYTEQGEDEPNINLITSNKVKGGFVSSTRGAGPVAIIVT